jgi:hypothetical protein
MVKPVTVSNATHQRLVRVQGERQAQLGRGVTFDDVLQLLVHEPDDLRRRRPQETDAPP